MNEKVDKGMVQKAIDLIKSFFWREKEKISEGTLRKIDDILPKHPPKKTDTNNSPFDEVIGDASGGEENSPFDEIIGDNNGGEKNSPFDEITGDKSGGEKIPQQEHPKQHEKHKESHFEDRDEYVPQDMEFGESLGEQNRFAEIAPGIIGYHPSGRLSHFDPQSNLWAKKKVLLPFSQKIDTSHRSHTYSGVFPAGTVSLPLPYAYLPDISTLQYSGKTTPVFSQDQNGIIYITSNEKQYISFSLFGNQKQTILPPIKEDGERIIYSKLSPNTEAFLQTLTVGDVKNSQKIKKYILQNKKYSEKVQGELHRKSNASNYIAHLDNSPILECFSANSLFVALCREVGLSARLVTGHMVQSLDKDGKGLLGSSNGHAWSEVWNEQTGIWEIYDATPTEKENGDKSDQNGQEGGQGGEGASGDSQENSQGKEGETNQGDSTDGESESGKEGEGSDTSQGGGNGKSPSQTLEELIEKAKKDNLKKQEEQLEEEKKKIEQAHSKEEVRDILDNSELTDFAKDELTKQGNEKILKEEEELIKQATDEGDIDSLLENSLLDKDFKEKLKEYAKEIKKQIEEERKKREKDMEQMGFKKDEVEMYKLYKILEKEVDGEVRKQIRILERILPPRYQTLYNEDEHFVSGSKLGNTGKLIEHELTGDPKVFRREKSERESSEINMFETIMIDRSNSMGKFKDINSPLRQAVKAAIIRAKVLEHFKVNFSILIFDTEIEEVMKFGEKFSSKRGSTIPAKLMRAVSKSGGTDIGKPLTHTLASMTDYARKNGKQSFGNISFLGDGAPQEGLKGQALKTLVKQIRAKGFRLTAYYIDNSGQKQNDLVEYFGDESSGGTIFVDDVTKLSDILLSDYNKNLKSIVQRYAKK